jgi:hypothetical protein
MAGVFDSNCNNNVLEPVPQGNIQQKNALDCGLTFERQLLSEDAQRAVVVTL